MIIKNILCSIMFTICFITYAADELSKTQDNQDTYTIGTIDRQVLKEHIFEKGFKVVQNALSNPTLLLHNLTSLETSNPDVCEKYILKKGIEVVQNEIANHTFFVQDLTSPATLKPNPYVIEKIVLIKQSSNSELINSIFYYLNNLYINPLLLPNDIESITSFPGNRLNADKYQSNGKKFSTIYRNITRVDYCTDVDSMHAENPIPQTHDIAKVRSEFYHQESLLKALDDCAKDFSINKK